ncbi:hypothetical protein FQA39_LY18276 [Lamprigera yunnana]|nr:hypothetical protein FQA39_LY18276 [Lamprigera yunnana]
MLVFLRLDDFHKAKQKIKKAEFTSEVASDENQNEVDYPIKRKRSVVRRFYDSDDEDEGCKKTILQRPPQIKVSKQEAAARSAVQSISLPKNCSPSISSPSTSSFIINEYDSDDILSKGMSDENLCNLEFNNNVIDCDRSKISTPSNDKLLKLLLFLKEQNTPILKELKILNSKPNIQSTRQMYRRVANTISEICETEKATCNIATSYSQCASQQFTILEEASSTEIHNMTEYESDITCGVPSPSPLYDSTSSDENLLLQLRCWATENKDVPQSAVTELLHILKSFQPELPLTCKTLLQTPINFVSTQLESGEYILEPKEAFFSGFRKVVQILDT